MASTTSYEAILNNYKTKKQIMEKTKQKEQEQYQGKGTAQGNSYLNFLEKQVDRANTAYQSVASLQDQMVDNQQRIDLLELGQQDLIKKFRILEQINFGVNDDYTLCKKSIDTLYLKLQEIESRFPQTNNIQEIQGNYQTLKIVNEQVCQKLDSSLQNMEVRINEILTKETDQILQLREQNLERKLIEIIDNQAKDIAYDFSQLDRNVAELKQQLNFMVTSSGENRNPNLQTKNFASDYIINDLKYQISVKADQREIETVKNEIQQEIQELSKKIKHVQMPKTIEKDLRAIENRLNLKMTNAIEKLGSVIIDRFKIKQIMKKQEKKLKGLIADASESRIMQQASPQSMVGEKNLLYKSQQSLNASNNSMLRALSPIRQEDSKLEKSTSLRNFKSKPQQNQEDNNLENSSSAFRKYQSRFKSDAEDNTREQKYIRSGMKLDESRDRKLEYISSGNKNIYKRLDSQNTIEARDKRSTRSRKRNEDQSITRNLLPKQASQSSEKRSVKKRVCCLDKADALERELSLSHSKSRQRSSQKRVHSKEDEKRVRESSQTLQQSEKKKHSRRESNNSTRKGMVKTLKAENSKQIETVNILFNILQPKFDEFQRSPAKEQQSALREKYISNLTEQSMMSKGGAAGDFGTMNTSIDRSQQLKVTNDRLAKLERMYEELSILEAKQKRKQQ